MRLSVSLVYLVATSLLQVVLAKRKKHHDVYQTRRKEIIQLRKLTIVNPSFMLALKEQEEALIVLEALEADAIKVQGEKKLVSLFSDDLNNPLYKVIERINKQMLIGKTPKTLADLFFIEQKRIERNNNG